MKDEVKNSEVGNRIRKIRNEKGLTTEKFGELFDPPASKGTISKWENGRYLPNNERLVVIANLGEVSVEELIYGSKTEQISNILLKEFGDSIDLEGVKDVIEFYEMTGEAYTINEDNIIRAYNSYMNSQITKDQKINITSKTKYADRSFSTFELSDLLNDDISDLQNEITIIEKQINNNLDEDEFLELNSIVNNLGLYSVHLEKIIEQVKIPSQDFYIYEGVIYFSVDINKITTKSVKFDISRYDGITVYDIYGQLIEIINDLDKEKLLEVIQKYPSTHEDVYKFELTRLPTKWFETDYETIKDPEKIQVISDKKFTNIQT